MSTHEERDELARVIDKTINEEYSPGDDVMGADIADTILAAGYRKPRTIGTAAELEALPFGSAVQTSDTDDTVVLKCKGEFFLNQSGAEISWTTLWRFGTRPFTVLYEPEAS